jgi:rhodanese-related sulfurtransferase
MTEERKTEGAGESLRGVLAIVIAGVFLGLAFNALGLASHPRRGLAWIKHETPLPSLEELQGAGAPAADTSARRSVPAGAPAGASPAAPVPAPAASPSAASPAQTQGGAAAQPPAAAALPPSATPEPSNPAAPPAVSTPGAGELPVVPDRDEAIEIKLTTVKKFFDAGAAVLVDAREAPEYAEGHVPGALSLPFDDVVANPALLGAVKGADRPIIIYCGGGDCELSRNLAANMLAEGIRKVLVFTGGFQEWRDAGYPVERGATRGGS